MLEYFDNLNKFKNNSIEVGSYFVYNYNIPIGQGSDGFFIKFNLLNYFLEYYNLICGKDYINYHDDVYISYYFYLIGKNINYIKRPYDKSIFELHLSTYTDALVNLNGKYERNNLLTKSNEILSLMDSNGEFNFLKNKFI